MTIAEDGSVRVLQRQRKNNLRGTIYSVPKSVGGRELEVVYCEDQLKQGKFVAAMRRARQSAAKHKGMFGEEAQAAEGVPAAAAVVEKQAESLITVGYGRKNPNAMHGREKRGKSKKNPFNPHAHIA